MLLITQGSSVQIIFRKEIKHVGKNESIYKEIEIGRKQM